MTSEEKQEIINAVLAALRTNSKTIAQLTPVSEMSDNDYLELNGGRKVSYVTLFAKYTPTDTLQESYVYIDTHKVDKDSRGLVDVHQAPVIFLDAMGSLDGHTLIGENGLEYRTNSKLIYDFPGGKFGAPKAGAVYISKNNFKKFVWNGTDLVELKADECPLFVDYMVPVAFEDIPVGGSYYVQSSHKIAVKIDASKTKTYDPLPDALYFFRDKGMIYTWDSSTSKWVPEGSDINFVNNLTTGGANKGLSAEMGKRLKEKIEEVQANIQRLYNNLGNIAFWDAAAKSAAAPIPLDWGGTKHLVTLDLNLTNAVVKHNGTAVADGATIQVEEYTALTLLVEAESGYALQSVTSSTTGAVVTDNGNGTYNVALTMGQSNVTLAITATAAHAYTISYGTMTNCSVVTSPAPTSILGGQSVEIEFSAESGYELDLSCFAVANADKVWSSATNKLTISNATGNVTISATASVPKLKFLRGYRYINPTTISNSTWTATGVDHSADCAASQMMHIPAPASAVSAIPTVNAFWGITAQNGEAAPVAIALFDIDGSTFTPLCSYTFKPGSSSKAGITSWAWATGKASADVVSAYNAGRLGIRCTINIKNNKLMHYSNSPYYGIQFGSFLFAPDNPAGNYEFTTDADGFLDQVFDF